MRRWRTPRASRRTCLYRHKLPRISTTAQEAADNENTENAYKMIGAGLALGLAGIGTGLSQGPIGAAAVGMIAEDEKKFTYGLIFTALPETIVLFGFLAIFLL